MDLSKYETLTGITVPTADVTRVTAQIVRTRLMLESMLGFTLDSKKVQENLYNELGKTPLECSCPSVDTSDLEEPDDVIGAYRLYSYNELDKYFFIDPFTQLNSVKLVFLRQGEEPNGITTKTYETDEIRIEALAGGFSKYLQPHSFCVCHCDHSIQLAVDAEWMFDSCLPNELLYVWTDMITYYGDCKALIKSESINSHSYTKDNVKAPEEYSRNLNIIKRYAGPYGSLSIQPTIGVR